MRVAPWLANKRVFELPLPVGVRRRLLLAGIHSLAQLEGLRRDDLVSLVALTPEEAREVLDLFPNGHHASPGRAHDPDTARAGSIARSSADGSGLNARDVSIDCLNLDRLEDGLVAAGIRSLGDIVNAPVGILESVEGIGARRANEIREAAARVLALPNEGFSRLIFSSDDGSIHLPAVGPSILAALAQAQSVEDEIYSLVVGMARVEDSLTVLRRWGVVEWPPPTLEVIASERGVTRERVRQIVAKREDLLRSSGLRLPFASIVADYLEAAGGVLDTATLLSSAARAGADCELTTLRVFEALGRFGLVTPFRYDETIGAWTTDKGQTAIESAGVKSRFDGIVRRARRFVRATGALPAATVSEFGIEARQAILRRVFRRHAYEEYADHFIRTQQGRTGLTMAVERMLAVAGRLSLVSIERGLKRMRRWWRVPSLDVIHRILENWQAVEVVDGIVRPAVPISPARVLNGAQLAALLHFERNGGILTWSELVQGMTAAGYSLPMAALIPREPFVRSLGRAAYALRGRPARR